MPSVVFARWSCVNSRVNPWIGRQVSLYISSLTPTPVSKERESSIQPKGRRMCVSGLWPCLPIKISTYGVRRFHISRSVWDRVCFPSDNDARPGRHIRSSCRRSLLAIPKCVDTYPFLLGFEKCTARDDEILFGWRDLRHSLRHYVIVALLRSTRHFDTFSSRPQCIY